jgi:hypothetical protein
MCCVGEVVRKLYTKQEVLGLSLQTTKLEVLVDIIFFLMQRSPDWEFGSKSPL